MSRPARRCGGAHGRRRRVAAARDGPRAATDRLSAPMRATFSLRGVAAPRRGGSARRASLLGRALRTQGAGAACTAAARRGRGLRGRGKARARPARPRRLPAAATERPCGGARGDSKVGAARQGGARRTCHAARTDGAGRRTAHVQKSSYIPGSEERRTAHVP